MRCINRDSVANKLMVSSFLIAITALLAIGCLRSQVPFFDRIIARANQKPQ
jgi:hypothetical protein